MLVILYLINRADSNMTCFQSVKRIAMVDVIENIKVKEFSYVNYDGYVEIECLVEFEATVDYSYHYDSKEPNMEVGGSIITELSVENN